MDIALPNLTTPHEAAPGDRTHREFVALVDAHGGAVLATLRRLCGDAHEADDLFQETAVRVWRNFEKRPWLRSPRAWLITIAYRAFLDSRRRGRCESPGLIPEVIDHRHESAEEFEFGADKAPLLAVTECGTVRARNNGPPLKDGNISFWTEDTRSPIGYRGFATKDAGDLPFGRFARLNPAFSTTLSGSAEAPGLDVINRPGTIEIAPLEEEAAQ